MRWKDLQRSDNIEDRRGEGGGLPLGGAAAGAPMLLRFLPLLLRTRIGRYILLIGAAVVGVSHFLGINLLGTLLGGGSTVTQSASSGGQISQAQLELGDFVAAVLGDTERTWHQIYRAAGSEYREPKLVLFSGRVNSACGSASSAMGPFYCPGDQKVYIDLSFYQDLKQRHGAPGDFAQAYVIAHEVGHHVQNLMGTSTKVHQAKQRVSKAEANQLSVRLELQADCYAGLWAHSAANERNLLEQGDLEEALTAASAIGDDRLQKQATGRVVPDSFTHGSSEQRVRWFSRGYESGDIAECNTFEKGVRL